VKKFCVVKSFLLTVVLVLSLIPSANSQTRRQIKVLVESQQSETHTQDALQGSGNIIIRKGTVHPSGRLTGADRQTTVQRSTGIFTLVQDGGESILSVATRVPQNQVAYFYHYASGSGYIAQHLVFTDVGTSLKVSAVVLPDNQIRVQLTPRISYFSADRSGAIDFAEAAMELIVPNGQRVSLGGATTNIHEVTRQILGYGHRSSSTATDMVITATIQ
jgi:hypothetical protein